MNTNTIIAISLTALLFLALYLCVRKFRALTTSKHLGPVEDLNSRIIKNWVDIQRSRTDNSSTIDELTHNFEVMDQLFDELSNLKVNQNSNRKKVIFLQQVSSASVEDVSKV